MSDKVGKGIAQDGWQPPRTTEIPRAPVNNGYQPPRQSQPNQVENPPPKKR
ncbi:TPA: hypothetical protein ACNVSH_002303 [Klebsiella aerogenes]|uniref:hypothetical protein n=1 Tax=Enterobacterales TaxID=91347 RepID=UPI0012DD4752|nr:hypothetical protein [Klebsiella aerogenes]EKU4981787.1 hypothetical protein [Klebsiella aerogenes]HBV6024596.1 hypothetical protein [Klebsiella aerogenes]HBZ8411352.1 hypothetical protein [Klebsiella aerogenes]HCM5458017.1 hypothetical protein [Klebsiella aerogenes]HDU4534438.1 hypothetical protein [Klebsiella aerogenes]